ncbi:amino acid ABC transporter permease [Shimia sp. R11_0]|uniref:amino acid ABC transporter permease n=1 Tax=Shimia sp. R11_0 TaxID=2821096 RepID=UPI001FFDFD9E|nr:amino acid ABC transporter permease [Shimia sp. R11_0]
MSDSQNNSVAFVATEVIPQSPPPARETGVVKWLRENLFSSVTNGVLTVVALYLIYLVLAATLPWIFNGIWTTSSLSECREVLQGKTGACFSVLTERWHQLIYGFKYPADAYWRPNLAFVLMLVAIAPVLFFDLPRKLLIVTAVYPFVAFWLIWGGSMWVPVTVFVALALAYSAYAVLAKESFAMSAFAFVGVVIVLLMNPLSWLLSLAGTMLSLFTVEPIVVDVTFRTSVVVGGEETQSAFLLSNVFPLIQYPQEFLDWALPVSLPAVPSRDLGGFMLNLMLGVTCVSLSIPLGIALALGRQSDMPLIKGICVVFIEFIRGVPLITLLFVASVMLAYFFPPESTVDLFLRVVIMITMFSAAYIAEVIRGGLAALPKGQYEAADSLGLDYPQAMRLIILPQALKISIPGIVNVAVGLFKDTTLVSVISMFDLIGMIRGPILASTEWNGVYWELFGFAALLFFVVCYGISQYSQWLERKLHKGH